MNKKNRKNLSNLIAGLYLLLSLCIYWFVIKSSNYFIFIGIIISTPVIETIIFQMLPDKKANKQKKNQSSNKVSKNKTNSKILSTNLLRSDDEILTLKLENLTWREFERLCFLFYKEKGYKPRETSEGADGGVDLIIYNRTHKTEEAIQIKHYIESCNQITVKEIRELNSSKRNHGCVLAKFITTSGYTNAALTQADKLKIDCHYINWVKSKIVKWQKEEALKRNLISKAK
ncbi:restriction endonuclease [Gottfriedia solisilvae]|uniref:restriction endonuclease n=1 Tax=Gottfriedia solisilvae TaxID=1516104 RepID=UPI003D2F2D28